MLQSVLAYVRTPILRCPSKNPSPLSPYRVLRLAVDCLHVLQPRLDNINGHGGRRRQEAADHAGAKVQHQAVLDGGVLAEELLGLRVGGQLRSVDNHGAGNSRAAALLQDQARAVDGLVSWMCGATALGAATLSSPPGDLTRHSVRMPSSFGTRVSTLMTLLYPLRSEAGALSRYVGAGVTMTLNGALTRAVHSKSKCREEEIFCKFQRKMAAS